MTCFVTLLVISAAGPDCSAQDSDVYLISDGDFNTAGNWDLPLRAPGTNLDDIYGIDDGLSATFSSGTTTVFGLRVGSAAKEHQFNDTRFGRLTMTGGTLEVIGDNRLVVGRERENKFFGGDYNKNSIVDAADYTVWRDTLGDGVTAGTGADGDQNGTIEEADFVFWRDRFGNVVKGGEFIMTGSSTVTANAMIVGERTKGLLTVGPSALVDVRFWDTLADPEPAFGGTADLRVGNYGPAYDQVGSEPGLDGDGLVDVEGTLNASTLLLSENGGKGEIRLSGGAVNLNGALVMSFCGGCGNTPNPAKLALMSSKVSILGSTGTFNVGLDPDPDTPDPDLIIDAPFSRDIRFNFAGGSLGYPATATFSFTADAGGVTPITVVDNGLDSESNPNLSGTAYIGGTTLELNLDAYTSMSPLTLINAADGHLDGEFGTVTFLGSRTAEVIYDVDNGDVYLDNFSGGAGAGSLASSAVPEPSGLPMMTLALGLFVFSFSERANRQTTRLWGYQCLKIRA